METSKTISRILSILIVIVIIVAAFSGFAVGAVSQRQPYSQPSTFTTTVYGSNTTTLTITKSVTPSAGGRIVTLSEYITDYDLQIDTV
ncbi:MAG: hypothetical protein JRN20_15680, partial [Nitrososphaerota archaeon]|nr:hypothetical protein [Nitrososphaerota archaeon]